MTDLGRLEMDGGAWATFRTRFGWGADIRIQATLLDGEGSEAFMRALVRETLTGWHVPSVDGGWLDTIDEAAFDAVDGHVGERVLDRCNVIWKAWRAGRPDPKDTPAPSESSPPGEPSQS